MEFIAYKKAEKSFSNVILYVCTKMIKTDLTQKIRVHLDQLLSLFKHSMFVTQLNSGYFTLTARQAQSVNAGKRKVATLKVPQCNSL